MAVSYKRLWKLLVDKEMCKSDLRKRQKFGIYIMKKENFLGEHVRWEQLPIDGYHLVVYVWIRNSKGEYLNS